MKTAQEIVQEILENSQQPYYDTMEEVRKLEIKLKYKDDCIKSQQLHITYLREQLEEVRGYEKN